MEEQEDHQQRTSSTRARPQQPTDSLAASLPTETLAQILNSSLEGLDSWERQQARLSFAQVCAGWYGAVDLGRELAVKNTSMAERCARSLAKKTVEQRNRIRSLSIEIEEKGIGRGQRAASLVKACTQLQKLQLVGLGGHSLGTSGHHLGEPLTDALKTRHKMKYFEITGKYYVPIHGDELFQILATWPELLTLDISTLVTQTSAYPLTAAAPTTALHRLRLPFESGTSDPVLTALLNSSSSTLRHVDLGILYTTATRLARRGPELTNALTSLAPQLLEFKIIIQPWDPSSYGPSTFLSASLCALRDVQLLALGTFGFPLATILPLLQPLQHLKQLSILQFTRGQRAPGPTLLSQLTSAATLDFIAEAPAIEALALPAQLETIWTKDELEQVKAAAVEKGVRFTLK